ncbi:hypothetical protein LZ30DRAFT_738299 [Colletotrichum cereale]|nr:hypothetical protein LZ30DRAFT_738299 [Colletotrichum cereale]
MKISYFPSLLLFGATTAQFTCSCTNPDGVSSVTQACCGNKTPFTGVFFPDGKQVSGTYDFGSEKCRFDGLSFNQTEFTTSFDFCCKDSIPLAYNKTQAVGTCI